MSFLHVNFSPGHYWCLTLCSFPPPHVAPRATAQLYPGPPGAVSEAKLCFLCDPAMSVSPGLFLPTDVVALYFLGRARLSQVYPALTVERTLDARTRCFSPSLSTPVSSVDNPNWLRQVRKFHKLLNSWTCAQLSRKVGSPPIWPYPF
jgi:hypothetical protein